MRPASAPIAKGPTGAIGLGGSKLGVARPGSSVGGERGRGAGGCQGITRVAMTGCSSGRLKARASAGSGTPCGCEGCRRDVAGSSGSEGCELDDTRGCESGRTKVAGSPMSSSTVSPDGVGRTLTGEISKVGGGSGRSGRGTAAGIDTSVGWCSTLGGSTGSADEASPDEVRGTSMINVWSAPSSSSLTTPRLVFEGIRSCARGQFRTVPRAGETA